MPQMPLHRGSLLGALRQRQPERVKGSLASESENLGSRLCMILSSHLCEPVSPQVSKEAVE